MATILLRDYAVNTTLSEYIRILKSFKSETQISLLLSDTARPRREHSWVVLPLYPNILCKRCPSGENTSMLFPEQLLMRMLSCLSKQKKKASETRIPFPLVNNERDLSPDKVNKCIVHGLSSLLTLNTNISLFENFTSTGRVMVWCCNESLNVNFVVRICILLFCRSAT